MVMIHGEKPEAIGVTSALEIGHKDGALRLLVGYST